MLQKYLTIYEDNDVAADSCFRPFCTPEFDDSLMIEVLVDLDLVEHNFGVPGSPVWLGIDDYTTLKVYINDQDYTYKELKNKFGRDSEIVQEIDRLIDEKLDNIDLTW